MDILRDISKYALSWVPNLYPEEDITLDYIIRLLLNHPKSIVFCILCGTFRFYLAQKWSYWSKRGVPGPTPTIMKFGNIVEYFAILENKADDLVAEHGDMFGFYAGRKPMVYLGDIGEWDSVLPLLACHGFV